MKAVTYFYAEDGTRFDNEAACRAYEDEQLRLAFEQWNFSFVIKRELKDKYKPVYKVCPDCRGRRVVGGGLGDPDGSRECDMCWGTGEVLDPEKTPIVVEAPAIPIELEEAMLKGWQEWWTQFNARRSL